jgi:hypothetical protein
LSGIEHFVPILYFIEMETMPSWIRALDEEEALFIKRFVMNSGSLKSMASEFGVSYPTLRKRLNRLIRKIESAEDPSFADALERLVGLLVAEGIVHAGTGRTLVQAHYQAMKDLAQDENPEAVG